MRSLGPRTQDGSAERPRFALRQPSSVRTDFARTRRPRPARSCVPLSRFRGNRPQQRRRDSPFRGFSPEPGERDAWFSAPPAQPSHSHDARLRRGSRRPSEVEGTHTHSVMSDCNESQMNYNKIWSFKKKTAPRVMLLETFSGSSLRAVVEVNNDPRQTHEVVSSPNVMQRVSHLIC